MTAGCLLLLRPALDAFRLIMLLSTGFVLTSLAVLILMVRPEAEAREAGAVVAEQKLS